MFPVAHPLAMIIDLLALCARDIRLNRDDGRLSAMLRQIEEQNLWARLIDAAEHHGLAPLFFKHVQDQDIQLPKEASRILRSLALRHHRISLIRNKAVAILLDACRAEGIRVIAAKGIALANQIYSNPGLRPMRDVDLLVDEADLARTQTLMMDLGYAAEPRQDIPEDYYHLAPMIMTIQGVTISVEIHRNLLPYHPDYPPWPLTRSWDACLPVTIGGVVAHTLCLEEMLLHIYLHGFRQPLTYEPYRLIHLADIVTLVEAGCDRIDWDRARRIFPAMRQVLSSLGCLCPWSDHVRRSLRLDTGLYPKRLGDPYSGWPRRKLRATALSWWPSLVRETFLPPQWWLQVYYGCLPGDGLARSRIIDHPRMVFRWVKAYFLHFVHSLIGRLFRSRR